MTDSPKYQLTIDLNALHHLGLNLYSNIPAVVSEVVANSWDADASKVEIDIDKNGKLITVVDDGWGMTEAEINAKFLKVGYDKRNNESTITPKGRHVMGRKGIGKLSLFSIANVIEVHSIKKNKSGKIIEKNGFIMRAKDIQKAIESNDGNGTYYPEPVDKRKISITKGTKITLSGLKKGVDTTEAHLRKRLARRFSIIGNEYKFSIIVQKKPINIEDRDYFKKVEYLWHIGKGSEKYVKYATSSRKHMKIDGNVDSENGYEISGWVGTFDEQKSIEEGNNTIVVLAWGKLIHEDILKDLKEGGLFTKYLIGEIRADFLDLDEKDDIATSDRQRLKESDPRFNKLKAYVQKEILKVIQSKWRDWRNEDAEKKALANPTIKKWFEQLGADNRKYARRLFGTIESFPIEDKSYKTEIYKHGILAFEKLALKENITAIENLQTEHDFDLLKSIFTGIDELEAFEYYQIVKGRIEVLKKFEDILPDSKERVIQQHIFNHLWLLHPSWERASTNQRMEESVTKEFKKVKLTEDERKGRIDIRYKTAAGKHIIVELKKYNVKVEIHDLAKQVSKYQIALEKCLKAKLPGDNHVIESICVMGSPPIPTGREDENREILRVHKARYITYDELIKETTDSYQEYLDKEKRITRILKLVESL
jgi:hypothetical protein